MFDSCLAIEVRGEVGSLLLAFPSGGAEPS